MSRLTRTEAQLLREMADGHTIHYRRGSRSRVAIVSLCFSRTTTVTMDLDKELFFRLRRRKLIMRSDRPIALEMNEYIITNKGRRLLNKLKFP